MQRSLGNLVGYRVRSWRFVTRFSFVSLLTFLLVTGWIPAAFGQLSLPSFNSSSSLPPRGVDRLGTFEATSVYFEGDELFRIASPTVWNRNAPGSQIPVEVRSKQIETNLNRVTGNVWTTEKKTEFYPSFGTNYDPRTLKVYSQIINGETVIVAIDRTHTQPLKLITITSLDADYNGMSVANLAQQWQSIIYERLHEALRERLPNTVITRLWMLIPIALAAIGISIVLWFLERLLYTREKGLRQAQSVAIEDFSANPREAPSETSLASHRQAHLDALLHRLSAKQRCHFVSSLRWLLAWMLIILWIGVAYWVLAQFPWTRQFSQQVLRIPSQLILIWFAAGLVNRIGDGLLNRLAEAWSEHEMLISSDFQRESLRISTTLTALKGLKTFLVYAIGFTFALSVLGMPIDSVLAGGAFVAFALSLGFQNLMKDLVMGCLILWEDQYAIGDVIAIGNQSGLVENMNLRITQLRNGEGRLITIPNSAIIQVENLTRNWSRIDFTIEVAYDADVDQVLSVIQTVAQQMYEEPEWHNCIIEPPDVLGVDNLSHTGMLIRVWIKTQPLRQWSVGREFRRRIRVMLDQHDIAIGKPQQEFWHKNGSFISTSTNSYPQDAESLTKQ